MKIDKIKNIKNSKIRLFPFQTQDIYFIMYNDLPSSYLLSLLIDKIGFNLNQFSLEYIYPFKNFFDSFSSKIETYDEKYFIFYLENYYHSSEYAYNFLIKTLEYIKINSIDVNIIISTLKTNDDKLDIIMKEYDSVRLIVSTDLEYFFNEFFYKRTDINDITNIIYRDDSGSIFKSEKGNVDHDLDEYIVGGYYNGYYTNFPKSKDAILNLRQKDKRKTYDDDIHYLWTNEKYGKKLKELGDDSVMLTTGRGCKFNCSYCYRGKKYSKVRQIPLDVIEKDLSYLDKLGYKNIYLYDDCFVSTNKDRIEEIVLLFGKYNFNYQIASRYEPLTKEILQKLAKAKINKIQIGLQSISLSSNIEMKRNLNLDNFIITIDEMKKNNIDISIDLILGLPGETLADFIKTFNFALNLKPTSIFINKLFLNPKTELYYNKSNYGIKTENDIGLEKDFYVPKVLSNEVFNERDILLAEKYISAFIKKSKFIEIIIR